MSPDPRSSDPRSAHEPAELGWFEPDLPPGSVSADFPCRRCGALAMCVSATIDEIPSATRASIAGFPGGVVITEFDGATHLTALGEITRSGDPEPLFAAIRIGRPAAVAAFDRELVPMWCPPCDAVYCWDHWITIPIFDEGFFDVMRGICPAGHDVMLWD